MARIDLVVIGASAGGLTALVELVRELPRSVSAAILVVIHTKSEGDSFLAPIIARAAPLPVVFATDGLPLERGRIAVAPPDHHLVVVRNHVVLVHGPKENGFRPAVDPLFRSAARWHGPRVMGVILSGALDDGTYGMKVIKQQGGIAVVQHPDEAVHPGMALNAMRHVDIDYVLPVAEIAGLIAQSGSHRTTGGRRMPRSEKPDPQNPAEVTDVERMEDAFGPPSGLTCPDCGGALWEIREGELPRYRCHVGHQFTTEGLDDEQREAVESALWTAVRMLEERAELRERMAQRAQQAGLTAVSSSFAESANDSQQQAHTIRQLLIGRQQHAGAADRVRHGEKKASARTAKKRVRTARRTARRPPS